MELIKFGIESGHLAALVTPAAPFGSCPRGMAVGADEQGGFAGDGGFVVRHCKRGLEGWKSKQGRGVSGTSRTPRSQPYQSSRAHLPRNRVRTKLIEESLVFGFLVETWSTVSRIFQSNGCLRGKEGV